MTTETTLPPILRALRKADVKMFVGHDGSAILGAKTEGTEICIHVNVLQDVDYFQTLPASAADAVQMCTGGAPLDAMRRFGSDDAADLPIILCNARWSLDTDIVSELVRSVSVANYVADASDHRSSLMNYRFELGDGYLNVVSTNGHALLNRYVPMESAEDVRVSVPSTLISAVDALLKKRGATLLECLMDNNVMSLTLLTAEGDMVTCVTTHKGDAYPAWRAVFPTADQTGDLTGHAELCAAILSTKKLKTEVLHCMLTPSGLPLVVGVDDEGEARAVAGYDGTLSDPYYDSAAPQHVYYTKYIATLVDAAADARSVRWGVFPCASTSSSMLRATITHELGGTDVLVMPRRVEGGPELTPGLYRHIVLGH